MADKTCPRCEAATHDGLLCGRCLSDAHKALRRIARHWLDLYLHKSGAGGVATGAFGARYPVPDNRIDVAGYVRNQLGTWARDLDMGDLAGIADDPVMWALWLSSRTQRIRAHEAGNEAVDEFVYCAQLVMRAVDAEIRRQGCGTCGICGADVFAVGDEAVGTCRRCQESGVLSQLPPLSQRTDLWARLEHEPMPRRLLMEALPMFGIHVKPARFRQWVHRGVLMHVDEVDGARRYLLSDVRVLVDGDAA